MKSFNQGTDKVRFRFIKVYSECYIEGNKSLLMYILFHIFDATYLLVRRTWLALLGVHGHCKIPRLHLGMADSLARALCYDRARSNSTQHGAVSTS